jgi:hypothetical protein
LKFLLDENLPPAFARALDALSSKDGHSVHHVRDVVPPRTSDVRWISTIGAEGGWSALSGDRRILTRRHELRALKEAKVTIFILAPGWAGPRFWEKAWMLVRWWPSLVEAACGSAPGTIFVIPHRQKPKSLKPHK